jgi:hypothetical protein
MQRFLPHGLGRWLVVVLALSGAMAGCKKHEAGQPCSGNQSACVDDHLGVFCAAGKFATMTCLGPSGCQTVGHDEVACDNPVAAIGDGCNQPDDAACTMDRTNALTCKGGQFVVAQPCKGPRGCTAQGETVYCDNALAEPGDVCTEEGDPACKGDRSSFMKCVKGKFEITNGCRGPKKCTVTEKPDENKEHFECDDSLTQPGDPCEDEGEESCSLDKKASDVCKGHKIVQGQPCPGASGCFYDAGAAHFGCDTKKR